jgi:hypothetical protein
VQRRDLVVELLAALVEAPQVLRQGRFDEGTVNEAGGFCILENFNRIQQAARIAVGKADQSLARAFIEFYLRS